MIRHSAACALQRRDPSATKHWQWSCDVECVEWHGHLRWYPPDEGGSITFTILEPPVQLDTDAYLTPDVVARQRRPPDVTRYTNGAVQITYHINPIRS